ncbi:50S ribosomal protein L18 [Candidatus Woesearchaeota archaeon]|nr:50S ribosomal protein L18 [Candidatus Woesearchaeota archaeon]
MANKKIKPIPYKRKRTGKTDYKKRLHLLLAKKPRLIVRTSNQKIMTQLAEFKTTGDIILLGVDSSALKKMGWTFSCKNLPAAYLTGYLLGKKALQKDIKEAILDIGFKSPLKGNKIYACLKGALDAGLDIPHSEEIFPSEDRISGKHIPNQTAKITETFEKIKKQIESQ